MQDYRRLKVWEKAHRLAIDVHHLAGTFPRIEGMALISQLRRAAFSVPANIAEGAGKPGDVEFRRFLRIALGSAAETDYHLLSARELSFVDAATHDELSARTAEVRRMLVGLIRSCSSTAAERQRNGSRAL